METLLTGIDKLIASGQAQWEREGKRVRVHLTGQGRAQTIRLKREGERYLFWSVVARARLIDGSAAKRRALAFRIWRRNALKSVVLFRVDDRDRVIGLVDLSIESMHDSELQFSIETLAKECDRFEFILTGRDVA